MSAKKTAKPSDSASPAQARLSEVRVEIDAIDRDIVRLLNERAGLSLEVGRIKAASKDLIFKPFREKEVMEKLVAASVGPLPHEHLRSVYREIISSSRSLQRPQLVAYLGPEGTFSYFAGVEFLGHTVHFQPKQDIQGVFQAVASREVELGVIPLENSLQGTVGQSLDFFLRYEVFIQSEIFCRISHSLLGKVEDLSQVLSVYSHPQPLAQCGAWLRTHLPQARIIPMESTAAAARRVANLPLDEGAAALGHRRLADMLGLNILATAVEDMADNWTRFVVIAPVPAGQEAKDKTSMLFTLPDRPGSLVEILTILAREGINMKKLESRPLRGEKWKYVFFVDVECDLEKGEYKQVLDEMANACHTLRILGSYPAGPYLDVSSR
jgi:chorismate mutase/prephenate dehydratase